MRLTTTILAFLAALFLITLAEGRSEDWRPLGLTGGGGMYSPAISAANGKLMMLNCDMSGHYFSKDGGRNWRMIHCTQLRSNRMCAGAFSPDDNDVAYATHTYSGRELKRTRDCGKTWETIHTFPAKIFGRIVVDRYNGSRIFAAGREQMWVSDNSGKSFSRCSGTSGTMSGFYCSPVLANGGRVFFFASDKGVWRSRDGRQFSPCSDGLPSTRILALAGASGRGKTNIYVSVPTSVEDGKLNGGIFRSTDFGKTWLSVMNEGLNLDTRSYDRWANGSHPTYTHLLASDADPRRIYAFNTNTAIAPPHHCSCYRSDNAGESWKSVYQADPRWNPCNVDLSYVESEDGQHYQSAPFGAAIDPNDADHLIWVENKVYITENGGNTWFTGHTRPARGENPKRPGCAWENNGLVVTSTWNYYVDPFARRRHYICYTDIGFSISEDAGDSWRWWSLRGRAPWRNTCYELAIDPRVKGKVWGAFSNVHDIPNGNIIRNRHRGSGGGGVCVSDDHCETWEVCPGLPDAPVVSIILDADSHPKKRELFAAVWNHGVFYSADGGVSWAKRSQGLANPECMRPVLLRLTEEGTLYCLVTARMVGSEFVTEGPGLYRSVDRGMTWQPVAADKRFLWPKSFTVDPENKARILLSCCDTGPENSGGLYETTDGSESWKRILRKGPQHSGAFFSPHHKGHIYATLSEGAPSYGLWLSKDDGRTFKAVEEMPFANCTRVAFHPRDKGIIYVLTFGGSVWQGTVE